MVKNLSTLKDWAKNNPAARKQQQADLYARQKANGSLWRQRNPDKQKLALRRAQLRRLGLTLEQYDAMAEAQRQRCAICDGEKTWRALAVDHCHKTGKVRSLLCSTCNNQLGVFERHRYKFEAYLRKHAS